MRKITITRTYELAADTTATECVSCEYRESRSQASAWNDRCNVFDVALDKVSLRNFVKRAPVCIAAEKATKAPAQDGAERCEACSSYHPDPEIDASIAAEAIEAEEADLRAGYAPRRWTCPCGASHSRGHHLAIGQHRCLACGYIGFGGVVSTRPVCAYCEGTRLSPPSAPATNGGE